MKKIIQISLVFCCFTLLFSCQKNKDKSSKSTSTSTQVDEKQQDELELKQELEVFDEMYSDYVKEFYNSLNKTNSFIKEGGKKEDQRKEIITNLSPKPENLNIDIPKNLEKEYETEIKSMKNIFSNFIVLQNELEKYIRSDAWKEDKRKTIYKLNAKAEELTLEYDKVFNELMSKLNKEN